VEDVPTPEKKLPFEGLRGMDGRGTTDKAARCAVERLEVEKKGVY
jgi:hypothetical protein